MTYKSAIQLIKDGKTYNIVGYHANCNTPFYIVDEKSESGHYIAFTSWDELIYE